MKNNNKKTTVSEFEEVFSVRYRPGLHRKRLEAIISGVATHYGLRALKTTSRLSHGFVNRDISSAAAMLFSSADLERLRRQGKHPLSAAKLKSLRKKAQVNRIKWSSKSAGARIFAELAKKNEIPALGAEIWLKRRIQLFGGFVTVRANTRALMRSVSDDLRRAIGVPPIWDLAN